MARIKSEAREKREKRELAEHLKSIEKYRREIALQKQYGNWDVGKYPDGRVELALVRITNHCYCKCFCISVFL